MTAAPLPLGCERAQVTAHTFPGACATGVTEGSAPSGQFPWESTGPAPGRSSFSSASSDEGIPCTSQTCLLRMSLSPSRVSTGALTSGRRPSGKPDTGGQHANRSGPEPKPNTGCVTKGKACRSGEFSLHNWCGKPCIWNIRINDAIPHLRPRILGAVVDLENSTSWSEARPESDLAQVPSAHPETFLRSGKAVVVGLLLHFLFCFVLFLFFFVIHLILIYFYAFIFKYIYFIFSNFNSMFSYFHTSYVFIYCFSPLVLIFFLTIFYLDLFLPL